MACLGYTNELKDDIGKIYEECLELDQIHGLSIIISHSEIMYSCYLYGVPRRQGSANFFKPVPIGQFEFISEFQFLIFKCA